MAGKKDRSLIYWNMNYKGKLRRTWVMLPICIIVGVIAPFYTAAEYGSVLLGVVIDVVLAVTWVLQLLYNMRKAREEEQEQRQATPTTGRPVDATFQAPTPAGPPAPQPNGTSLTGPTPFEQETGRLQMQMAYLAESLPDRAAIDDGRIQTVYVHAMVKNGRSAWDCFYRTGNALVASGDLMKTMPSDARSKFFASGRSLMDEYRGVCDRYHVDPPTELRIIFDPKAHALHTDVGYQTIGDSDPFMAWASEVYKGFQS